MLKVEQSCTEVQPLSHETAIDPYQLRCVCMSDTHNKTAKMELAIPDGDVFIHAGDFSMVGHPKEAVEFNDFLSNLPHRRKIVITGNHELSFDPYFMKPENVSKLGEFGLDQKTIRDELTARGLTHMKELLNCTNLIYLEDSLADICGVKIYGTPWHPDFGGWGFYLPAGDACRENWSLIPNETDVLVTHGPSFGKNDFSCNGHRAGCPDLLATIQKRVKPRFHVYGHIHEAYGMASDGVTTFINVSTCSLQYKPIQPPVIFDIPLPEGCNKEELDEDIDANTKLTS